MRTAPCLYHIDYSLKTIVRTDASAFTIGAMLLQVTPEGHEQPIAFVSKKFSHAARN